MFVNKDGIPLEFDFPDYVPPNNPERIDTFVGPQHILNVSGFEISIDDIIHAQAGNTRIFMYGWVEYYDIFNKNLRHRTETCVEVLIEGDPSKRDCGFSFTTVTEFNGNDEYCYRRHEELAPKLLADRLPRIARTQKPLEGEITVIEPASPMPISRRERRRRRGKSKGEN